MQPHHELIVRGVRRLHPAEGAADTHADAPEHRGSAFAGHAHAVPPLIEQGSERQRGQPLAVPLGIDVDEDAQERVAERRHVAIGIDVQRPTRESGVDDASALFRHPEAQGPMRIAA